MGRVAPSLKTLLKFHQTFKGVLHPNLKLACFVCYLRIINPFLEKNNAAP